MIIVFTFRPSEDRLFQIKDKFYDNTHLCLSFGGKGLQVAVVGILFLKLVFFKNNGHHKEVGS